MADGKSEVMQSSEFPAGVAAPAIRALNGAGYTRLDQLTRATEAEVKRLHGMGPKALDALREALKAQGKSFADSR
jgi:predicted flap endonuclease-1-like 5' DNA nuclease